jgi:rRNA maturation endonuclease Nob1
MFDPFLGVFYTQGYAISNYYPNLSSLQRPPEYYLPKEFREKSSPIQCNGCGATHNEDKCPYCGRQPI